MKLKLLALVSIFFFVWVHHALAQTNGTIHSIQKIEFPEYDSVQGISMYYSKQQYASAIQDISFSIIKIKYYSDGLKVIAYHAKSNSGKTGKFPVVIFNRGSYLRNDIAFVHAPLFQRLVKEGFMVFAPALRESEGGEGKDQLGGDDLNDILNLKPLLATFPNADTSQIFMLGESRGGIMTYLAAREKFPLKAIATVGAITDMQLFVRDNPGAEQLLIRILPEYNKNKSSYLSARSAIDWANQISIPVLILHGQSDPQVKPSHSLMLASKLQELNKTYQLLILQGGNHILSGNAIEERDEQIIAWFNKFRHSK